MNDESLHPTAGRGGHSPRTIAVLGATGRTGRRVVEQALSAGDRVRALVRSPDALDDLAQAALTVLPGDAAAPADVARLLDEADALISAVGGGTTADPGVTRSTSAGNIVRALAARNDSTTRVIIVAGGGILDSPAGGLRQDQPSFPAIFRAVSEEHRRVWETVRDSSVAWTMVCTGDIEAGERTGAPRTLVDRMPEGGRRISIDDLAAFLLEQVDDERFLRRRVGLVE